jgi:hypothetical protein
MNYLDEFEFELNEAKNICHVYTDKLRHNPNDVENIYHVCRDNLRYKLIDTICLIESPQADEDDVWVPVSRYTQAVLGIQTNDIEKVKDIYSKNYEAICGFLNKDRREI